jgi:tRNA uridine 5-carboxymethylaminomethyl modification enzyme
MDIAQAVSGYIAKMVSVGDSTSGTQGAKMKALLLDRDTVGLCHFPNPFPQAYVLKVAIVSTATTQSTLLNHEIYLTEYATSLLTHLN